jgi:hypothetical protein
VGIGRNFADNDQVTLEVGIPVRPTLLLTPSVTYLRQGEGDLNAPYPPAGSTQLGQTPQFLIGVVEKTFRVGLRAEAWSRTGRARVEAGYRHVENPDHFAGAGRDAFEARLTLTWGFDWQGKLK